MSRPSSIRPAARRGLGEAIGFWATAATFATVMASAAIPTPLYDLYARRDGFGSFLITVVFAGYAIAVILTLLTAGHVSDWWGRRTVLLPATGLAIVSTVLFIVWRDLPGLIVARFISGLAVGATTATATAWISDLHAAHRPEASSRRAEIVSVVANVGGIGSGALVSGILAQWVRAPLTVPYVVVLCLLLLGAGAVALTPETRRIPAGERPRYHVQRVRVPDRSRSAFAGALGLGFVAFSAFGLFSSLAPTFLTGTLHHSSLALSGFAAFLVFAAAAVSQVFLKPGRPLTLSIGFAGTGAGAVLIVVAIWLSSPSLGLFLAGGLVLGIGAGAAFKSAVSTVLALSDEATRAEVIAALFLAAYLGIMIPSVGVGVLDQIVSARVALLAFGIALVSVLAASAPLLRSSRGSRTGSPRSGTDRAPSPST